MRSNRLVTAGIGLVLVAALSDQFENYILLRILDRFPGDQSTIDTLYFEPRLKFMALGIATAFAGLLHLHSPGWRKFVGIVAIVGGFWSAIGMFVNYDWVLKGMTLGWVALAVAAFVLSFRRSNGFAAS